MSSAFEDTVFDFDLNFLRQTTNNTSLQNPSKLEKQKRSISIVKKKIIATDSLIAKYYGKRQELEETQRNLLAAKDECKQICIDYTNALETCAKLETDIQIIQRTSKQYEERCFNSENQCEAFKSHANQLQALVNEQKSTIESMKVDAKLEKGNNVNHEKKVLSLQKENGTYLEHLCIFRDIILGKRKLNSRYRALLQQYKKLSSEKNNDDSLSDGANSDTGDDIFQDAMSPYNNHDSPQNNASEVEKGNVDSKHVTPMDLDNDCSNEIVSVDTGRGSSLAFSDNEKCFNSPDYFIEDSPMSKETDENRVKAKLVSISTSPLPLRTTVEVATSPINVLQEESVLYQIIIEEENSLDNNSISEKKLEKATQDRSLSPIKFNELKSVFTSPIRTVSKEVATSPLKVNNVIDEQIPPNTLQEKECLERNNSNNFLNDNSNDCEIESILHAMRLNYEIVTPIPTTPSKSRATDLAIKPNSQINHVEHSKSYVCQEAALAWEENKKMQASISHLAKEIVNIKCLLKTQLFSNKMFANRDSDETLVEDMFNDSEMNVMDDVDLTQADVDNERNVCSPLADDPIIIPNLDMQLIQPADLDIDTSQAELTLQSSEIISDGESTQHTLIGNKSPEQIMHRLQFEDTMSVSSMANDSISTQTSNVACLDLENKVPNKNVEVDNAQSTKDNHDKIIRNKKLTKLEKLKKRLVPKYKIKRDRMPPSKKLRIRPKKLLPTKNNIKIKVSDSSASLNDKNVYENAVKVMAELKAKNLSTTKSSAKMNVSITDDNNTNPSEEIKTDNSGKLVSPTPSITTRSRRKCATQSESSENLPKENKRLSNNNSESISLEPSQEDNIKSLKQTTEKISRTSPRLTRKRNRQSSSDKCEVQCKRMLRSSTIQQSTNDDIKKCETVTESHKGKPLTAHSETENCDESDSRNLSVSVSSPSANQGVEQNDDRASVVTYDDLDLFSETNCLKAKTSAVDSGKDRNCSEVKSHTADNGISKTSSLNPTESILFTMVVKHGKQSLKTSSAKKISDGTTKSICSMIESNIAKILELSTNETKDAMNKFVADVQKLNYKHFISGLMKYLKSPERKTELFAKIVSPPAPAMTKSEQILLYVIAQVRNSWPSVDAADGVLCNIEYTLFKLNQTPEFDAIESLSHFYAVLCRYLRAKSRLRLFILDAMYCIRFKAIPLIKQCLDVWMHIIPLAHMGIAKTPLVMCLVYLLHFYKCEDKAQRIQEIRNILHKKYFYKLTEWNETKVLEMFKNSIKDLKDIPIEKKSLRLALIILAKRHGPRWCQNNIIKNLLQPLIEKQEVPDKVKEFSLSMIGPLMKPYPVDMKVHCEIAITQLIGIWNKNPTKRMEEAIVTSLVYMSKHNQIRVYKILLSRKLEVSPELERVLRDFVMEKPLKVWKNIISRSRLQQCDVEDSEY